MEERQQINIESAVGSKVVFQLHRAAFDQLGLQGVESERFVARIAGIDGFGVWIENPNYCTIPTYSDEGEYIPPELRQELCDRAVILIMWPYIQTIMQFPDRPNYHANVAQTEIGFRARLQPANVVPQELTPIGVTGPTEVPVNQNLLSGKIGKDSGKGKGKKGGKRG
jgi:hypothetical protein